ncbi:acyltransferase [Yoonia sp. I 8.24]|uniref:acyltransferase family protein n=1 Tax=Yoonia sp. I 8.24 TaxID=1537229 RepID=UPI001EE14A9E|nr:acyltransferase [Yoonia sp. I 8.24]MCG3268850.1 acyltransferase [Yoonia sp. I 8.24]
MTPGLSIWLDVLRVWATLIVVISHIAYPRFTRGDYIIIRELNLGSDSVIVFFVLSGLVIAYAAERDKKLSTYSFNRATRLLSALLPALLLTFMLDQAGKVIGPQAYTSFYNSTSMTEFMLRGLTMSNEWNILQRIRLGSNGPLWSLSYEAAYYILFALVFFLTGMRRIALVLLCGWMVGPRILLLMPAWMMGVCLWNWLASGGAQRLSQSRARLFAFGAPLAYIVCQFANVPDMLADFTAITFSPFLDRRLLGFSDEFVWNGVIGGLASIHIMGMARLLMAYKGHHPQIRWWAGATFSIYVTHYPILHFIDAVIVAETVWRDLLFLVVSVGFGLIFAALFERPIRRFRAVIASRIPR